MSVEKLFLTLEQKEKLYGVMAEIIVTNKPRSLSAIHPPNVPDEFMAGLRRCMDTMEFKIEDGKATVSCEF